MISPQCFSCLFRLFLMPQFFDKIRHNCCSLMGCWLLLLYSFFFCIDSDLRQLFYIFLVNQHDEEDQFHLLVSPESPQVVASLPLLLLSLQFILRCPERKANTHSRITDTLEVTWGHVCFRTQCLMPLNNPGCNFSFLQYLQSFGPSLHKAVVLAVAVKVSPSFFQPPRPRDSHQVSPSSPLTRSSVFGLFFCWAGNLFLPAVVKQRNGTSRAEFSEPMLALQLESNNFFFLLLILVYIPSDQRAKNLLWSHIFESHTVISSISISII